MAHVHIRQTGESRNGKRIVNMIYHIPIDNPNAQIIPTPVSVIDAELDQAEKDGLAAGSIVELTRNIVLPEAMSKADAAPKIKQDWQTVKAAHNADYNFTYKYFGATIVDATT